MGIIYFFLTFRKVQEVYKLPVVILCSVVDNDLHIFGIKQEIAKDYLPSVKAYLIVYQILYVSI